MRFAAVAFALVVGAPWNALAQPVASAAPASPAGTPAARQYLWEVASLTNRVYLYGTVHAGKRSFYPLADAVEKAFAESKVLVVEADITDAEAMTKGAQSMLLVPPDRLDKHVSAPVYARFRKQLDRLGVPEPQMAQMKPFTAASLLAFAEWGRQGYHPQYGVDLHLINRARESGKRLAELEGAQVQSSLMDSLSPKESVQAFEGTVAALESGLTREQITGMVNAWQSGDAELLLEVARMYNESVPGAKELEEKFIWSRHEAMVGKIETYLLERRERVFVAVGALHLAGPRGLVQMLKARGFAVRQL
jgi:uncharacterized protein YbaP (TraB family)